MLTDLLLSAMPLDIRTPVRAAIEHSIFLRPQNVVDYFFQHAAEEYDGLNTIPTPIPPWPRIWAEWELPKEICRDGKIETSPLQGPVGALVTTKRTPDKGWAVEMMVFAGNVGLIFICPNVINSDGMANDNIPYEIKEGFTNMLRAHGIDSALPDMNETGDLLFGLMAPTITIPMYLAFSFANCKNVEAIAEPLSSALIQRRIKRDRVAVHRTYTLQIDPMKKVLEREGNISEHGLVKALHICRGHFKSFSDEKPLFGKFTGQYWWGSQVRGKREAGTVDKDYMVKVPKK